ncbi:asparagine synthase-related protein [Paraglaciecola arctica]|uniref:asparagine synthase-related protein n=1 Tax=Paraglaciecola arctica TaxID=1128911 RepID=UPI001C0771F2|nr:asparagine synthase C-terminal domain-containing protein [Paraglaciecola arctica]MBU3004324.1 asparagine synthase C-terminal domain-containing protein [Paraglaciecola arctica]
MFVCIFKEASQNVNKNVMFDGSDSFRKKLRTHYPQRFAGLISIEKENNLILYCDDSAKFEPIFGFADFNRKIVNKSILLGESAGAKISFSSSLNGDDCTSLDNSAHKLSKMFAQDKSEIFSKLENSFLLVAIAADQNSIHIATNPLSSRSIYWVEDTDCRIVSTDLQFIQTMMGKELTLSERGLSSWLSGYPNPAISLFEQVNVLPIGYRLELPMANKAKIVKFWDIEPDNKLILNNQTEYSQRFTELLNSSVVSACDSQQQIVASQMSGGLDSTSVTALANAHLKAVGKKVLPLSHLYTQSKKSDESQLVKDMLSFLEIDQSIQMPVDEGENRDFLALYPSDIESPGTVLSPRYKQELALVKAAGADVLLTGNGGDEMCWGHSAAYTQRFKDGDWGVVSEVLKASSAVGVSKRQALKNLFVKPFIPELLLKILTLNSKNNDTDSVPIWLTAKAKALALEETRINNPFDINKDPVGYNRYTSLKTTSTYNSVHSYGKVAQQFGIDVRHPFFDTKLAEFTFAIPAKQLIQGAYPKWLLRQSMDSYLPKSVCWNVQKTVFDQHFGNLVRENAPALREILQDTRLADMGLINQTLLLAEFDRIVGDPNIPLQVDLLYVILTFTWLQTHFPE